MLNNLPRKIRVVMADDHVIVRAGFRQFLEQHADIEVVAEASHGKEACEMIERYQPDVAVLDIQMPQMSGIDVTRWVRQKGIPAGILILTAYDDDPYIQAVLRAGANGYMLKTAQPQEIVQAVCEVYQGKLALDVALTHKLAAWITHKNEPALTEALTERETEILTLTAKGLTNKAIAAQLSISDRTVQNHLANIFGKLHAASRTEAVMRAVSLGLIPANISD